MTSLYDVPIRSLEGVDYTYTTIGAGATGTVTQGEVFVSLFELGERASQTEMMVRTRESLAHILCEPCPVCEGRGELKTAQTVCYKILRELLRESRQFNAREFRILASQQVIDMFLDEESQGLAMLSDFIGKPVSLQVESVYNQEQFDIILM